MQRQIPFISSIRQPLRTLIFILLVGLASFGFVSRAVEYIILNREITRIERFYRTTGTLVPIDVTAPNNVYEAAQLLEGSPLIEFHDRRAIVQGFMNDRPNAVSGFRTVGGNIFQRGQPPFDYKGLFPFDTIAVIEVQGIMRRPLRLSNNDIETDRITVRPQEILFGHEQFMPVRRYMADLLVNEDGVSIGQGLRMGGHYLVRASRQSRTCNTIEIFPLVDDIYFVCMNDRDKLREVMNALARELAGIEQNTNMVMITGTKDMTALPMVQNRAIMPAMGRFVTYEDYVNANPVIVIPWRMYSPRFNSQIGDTLTITLRDMRTFTDGAPFPPPGHYYAARLPVGIEAHWANMPAGYWTSIPRDYTGNWRNYPTMEIELEIVGTYRTWEMPRWVHISDSFQNMEVFIPASVIPEGFGIVDMHLVSGAYSFVLNSPRDIPRFTVRYGDRLAGMGFAVQFSGPDAANFWRSASPIRNAIRLNLVLFTGVLAVALALTVFLYLRQRYKEFAIMRVLGSSAKTSTWNILVPVLLIWLPVVAIAVFGGWNFAIHQAESGLEALAEVDITEQLEPSVVRNILEQMRFDAEQALLEDEPIINIRYLFIMGGAMFVVWVLAVLTGVGYFSKQSMISLIQSAQGGGAVVPAAKETAPPKAVKLADVFNFSQISRSIGGCIMAVVRHHRRHVMRMPVKSLLVVGMALLFVAALGWLDATITFTENEIARLHETTLVTGEVREVGAGMADDMWGQNIPHESITALRESGFVDTYYMTVINRGIGIFPPMEWEEGTLDWNIFRSYQALALGPAPVPIEDIAKTFSCWDIFMEDITRPVEFGVGMDTEFILEFAPGYGVEDFVIEFERVYEGEEYSYVLHTIPVIVHESLLERDLIIYAGGVMYYEPFFDAEVTHQRLSLGDYAYLGSAAMNPNHTPVKIIGIYRGGHPRTAYRGGRGLILAPYGLWGGTVATFEFTISQDMVPYLPEFEREMAERLLFTRYNEWEQEFAGETITHVWTQDFAHELVLNDAELTMVVGPLENNLHLLRILYPVAVGLSFVLALGLSLLLMLQNAKNAAVMRVLGMPRHRTRLNLCMELLAVCMAGLVPGLIAVLIMGVGIATAALLVGLYLAGAVIGTVAGVIVISQKAPMELLQVRE